jgi:hypothetical protein
MADPIYQQAGCPYSAIGLLTGEDPFRVRDRYKGNPSMDSKTMLKHLSEHEFVYKDISKVRTLEKMLDDGRVVQASNVILATVRMSTADNSWVVIYGGMLWHNFVPIKTDFSSCYAYRPVESFLITHPEWGHASALKSVLRKEYEKYAEYGISLDI